MKVAASLLVSVLNLASLAACGHDGTTTSALDAGLDPVAAQAAAPVDAAALPVPDRLGGREVVGPASIAEDDCTIWVPDGWVAREGAAGALVIRRAR